jgi:hypothetical protein
MPLPKDEAWFPAKTHGWGWGFPHRWRGRLVLAVFFLAVVAGAPMIEKSRTDYIAYTFTLTALLVVILYWKGEKPHWSPGKRDE